MKPSLQLLTERRGRRKTSVPGRTWGSRAGGSGAARSGIHHGGAPDDSPTELRDDLLAPDHAFLRVRHSGGPEDHAYYACSCGYVFEANVSTTVSCPHCGDQQAW